MNKRKPTSAREAKTMKSPPVIAHSRVDTAQRRTGHRVISSVQLHDWLASKAEYRIRAEAS